MSQTFKLATVVVCWYPNDELLLNIASYFAGSDCLIIWDNTPGGSSLIDSIDNAIVLNHGKQNMGLAYAYNRAIELAGQNGSTHIMTMDQDSRFDNFELFRDKVKCYPESMVCPSINEHLLDDTVVPHAAQSGCVFPLDMIKKVGGFREDFFIGMVDVEMQLKAQESGYKIIQAGGCHLIHHIGSERKVSFWGHSISVSDYSPLRHYYDSRNRILMWKEFPQDYNCKGKVKHMFGRLKVMTKILLFENNKASKSIAIIRGTWNGLLNRVLPY